jgi:hypothetical protein
VLLDAREASGDAVATGPERLGDYSAIANVVGHFDWGLALRDDAGIEVSADEVAVGVAPEGFWTTDDAGLPDCEVLLATIPPAAPPEHVLAQLARVR